jgi:predicted flap endonuclease-1-like 5' DNA nuclease
MGELRRIPGVGEKTEQDLIRLGFDTIKSLENADPEEIYARDCTLRGPIDRCQLYVYRCAVYFANTPEPEPEKLKWWHWKDNK